MCVCVWCAQLDDWVLCRIYKKSTNAQRTGKERDSSSCVEEVSLLILVNNTQILLFFPFKASCTLKSVIRARISTLILLVVVYESRNLYLFQDYLFSAWYCLHASSSFLSFVDWSKHCNVFHFLCPHEADPGLFTSWMKHIATQNGEIWNLNQ